ncbi:MAG TPA: peptidylprolyl isomerase [Candidatus Solibacter sp.]|nr:peptidylprolyl isomerase [Candidatus Solibacter sp.]
MKYLAVALLCLHALSAQALPPMPKLPDDTPIAEFDDGTKFTMGDFKKVYSVLSPAQQQMAMRDRMQFLQQWAFMRKLAHMAEQEKLAEKTPYKEAIEQYRLQILSEAKISDAINQVVIAPDEIVKSYENNKSKFSQVKVKALYIAFGDSLNESQAEAKAKKLLANARGGADFVKLIHQNSDDETSRAKDGDFDTLRQTDNIPDAFRTAVFALKKGEISEPLKQPNGFYLLRAEEVSYRPLSDVRDDIYNELKNAKAREWLDRMNLSTVVKVLNPAFLGK